MKTIEASTIILLLFFALLAASVSALTSLSFGGKSGDWIEYGLQEPLSSASDQWERMEFLSVAGTNVTVRATVYTSTWTEMNETSTVDLTSQDDFSMALFNARVYFIPGGLGIGDSVYLGGGFGVRTITGETTRPYTGANRRVIYANFSQQGNNYVFYWDKQTGALTEGVKTFGIASNAVIVTGTSMWGTEFGWWLWIIIIIAIALGVLSSRKGFMKKLRKKRDAQPTLTKVSFFCLLFKREKLIEMGGFIWQRPQ